MSTNLEPIENPADCEGADLQLVTFEVGEATLSLEISSVQEINRNMQLTAVPHAPPFVRGVTNLRGEVVSILDIHIILGIPSVETGPASRNLIVNHNDDMFGLRVDRVSDIMSVRSSDLTMPPSNLQGVPKKLIQGVYQAEDHLILQLDLNELMKCCYETGT